MKKKNHRNVEMIKKFMILCMSMAMIFMVTACGDEGVEDEETLVYEPIPAQEEASSATPEEISLPGKIQDQSFEMELDEWGTVMFVSEAPENGVGTPDFLLLKDEREVYRFPKIESDREDFSNVNAVSFRDFNGDDKTDIIVLVEYTDGSSTWNEPQIFLQDNAETMFYLDYPDLESYRLEAESDAGPAFYRDTLLEEYLSKQHLTDKISDIEGSWIDYIEYLDESLYASFSVERQYEIFAQQRDVWIGDMESYADRCCYTLTDMNCDGQLELIVSSFGGTGFYTHSRFYQIDETGNVVEIPSSFVETDSQPDLMAGENITVYSDWSSSMVRYYYIVNDILKVDMRNYVYVMGSISLFDDTVTYTNLSVKTVEYVGEDNTESVVCEDFNGNTLTEEEYENFADSYYSDLGYTKEEVSLSWQEISEIKELSDEEAAEMLEEALYSYI